MVYRVKVWDRSTGVHRLVGEMTSEIPKVGHPRSVFRYEADYIDRYDTFALDPVSLPLKTESFSIDYSLFEVFEESLPGIRGRELLVRRDNISQQDRTLPKLLCAMGNSGLGALSFSDNEEPQPPSPYFLINNLPDIVTAFEHYENGSITDSELSLLFKTTISPGGSGPKTAVFDEKSRIHYLAKFPSVNDEVDVVRIEAATMKLAAKCGLVVPATNVIQCAGKPVLLVQRFDKIPAGLRHTISLQTLLKAHDHYRLRYQDIQNVIRKYSNEPQDDVDQLYRQMVFNAIVGNTDDHLRNFRMMFDYDFGWRISPAYGLVPDIGQRGKHILYYDLDAYYPGRRKLENMGWQWGIRDAEVVVSEVLDTVACWKDEFTRAGVHEDDVMRFKDIDDRMKQ